MPPATATTTTTTTTTSVPVRRATTALFLLLTLEAVYTNGFLPQRIRRLTGKNPALFPTPSNNHPCYASSSGSRRWTQQLNRTPKDNIREDDDDVFVTSLGATNNDVNIDPSLSRPFLNNPHDPKSLLFSDSSPCSFLDQQQQQQQQQQSRNEKDKGDENDNDTAALRVWRTCKQQLPFVLTGARTATTADENPVGGVYNIVFVRLPTILAGLVYTKNLLLDGHGMIVDLGFGAGPFELPPIVVGAALYVILR
jgi:hypothetical protein